MWLASRRLATPGIEHECTKIKKDGTEFLETLRLYRKSEWRYVSLLLDAMIQNSDRKRLHNRGLFEIALHSIKQIDHALI